MAAGCKSFSSSGIDEMEPVADPLKYRKVVGIGLTTAGQMFAQRLRAGEKDCATATGVFRRSSCFQPL